MVNGGDREGGNINGNRGSGIPSIFLKYQTDTFSLDAEDLKSQQSKGWILSSLKEGNI